MLNVLFLCTGNSARSIMAEALLNHLPTQEQTFHAFSAGSHPKGSVHPMALAVLRERGISVEGLRSKSWDEFAGPGAPRMDLVITVCDNAAGEICPLWPGHPSKGHWSIPDPAAVPEAAQRRAFEEAFARLTRHIEELVDHAAGNE
jgi:arsenate reductase